MDKRILKAYERYDYNGKVVPGSLVLRSKMPKNGRWKEVTGYECCNPVVLYYTPTLPITGPYTSLFCNIDPISPTFISGTYTTLSELIAALIANPSTSDYGNWTIGPNGSVKLTVSPTVVTNSGCLSAEGTLSFTIIPY